MKNLLNIFDRYPGIWMSVVLAGLLLAPAHAMGQSRDAEQSDTFSDHVRSTYLDADRIVPAEFSPLQFETAGHAGLSLLAVKTTHQQQNNRVTRFRNNDDDDDRPGFIYRYRYIIAGTAAAVGVGTYLLLKSDGSGGTPGYLPIPPGRP